MTVSERLRANLSLALARHYCAGGSKLTIATLAPLAGSSRFTLARLGGHTRIATLQGIAGALGCTVADLVEGVEGVEPTLPVNLGEQPDGIEGFEVVVAGMGFEDGDVAILSEAEPGKTTTAPPWAEFGMMQLGLQLRLMALAITIGDAPESPDFTASQAQQIQDWATTMVELVGDLDPLPSDSRPQDGGLQEAFDDLIAFLL